MRITLEEGLSQLSGPAGQRFAVMFRRGTLVVEVYAPRGTDPQKPHAQDELYVVITGRGTFVRGAERYPFGPGDCLFVPAGEEHRFVDFSDDLAVWVFFYGPPGGEGDGGVTE